MSRSNLRAEGLPLKRTSLGFLKGLARDRRGVSAVEFALIAPLMISFYFGIGEMCQGYMAQKRVAHTASAMANLVAQTVTVSTTELDDVMAVGGLIMKPFPTSSLTTRITSVTRDANGIAKVNWSQATGPGLAAYKPTDVVTVPSGIIANGASLVMAETLYDYSSPVKYVLPAVTKMKGTFYELPRKVPQVACSNCPTK